MSWGRIRRCQHPVPSGIRGPGAILGEHLAIGKSNPAFRDCLNGLRQGFTFGSEDSSRQARGRVIGFDRAPTLQDDGAVIVDLIHRVHGAAAFGVALGQYGGVNTIAVHAGATVSGQQGWMNVHDSIVPTGSDSEVPQIAAEAHEFNPGMFERLVNPIRGVSFGQDRDHFNRKSGITAASDSGHVFAVGQHHFDRCGDVAAHDRGLQIEHGAAPARDQAAEPTWTISGQLESPCVGGALNGIAFPAAFTETMAKHALVTSTRSPVAYRSASTKTSTDTDEVPVPTVRVRKATTSPVNTGARNCTPSIDAVTQRCRPWRRASR